MKGDVLKLLLSAVEEGIKTSELFEPHHMTNPFNVGAVLIVGSEF